MTIDYEDHFCYPCGPDTDRPVRFHNHRAWAIHMARAHDGINTSMLCTSDCPGVDDIPRTVKSIVKFVNRRRE